MVNLLVYYCFYSAAFKSFLADQGKSFSDTFHIHALYLNNQPTQGILCPFYNHSEHNQYDTIYLYLKYNYYIPPTDTKAVAISSLMS